ncbi:MAG: hypothetical protein NC453_24855 [Muribaculum sp.]|nr:hypothetical protein [Muribaculum sp.]
MLDLPPPETSVPGNVTGVSSSTLGARFQKTNTMISQHEHIVAIVFGCPFMVAMYEGRHEEMPKLYHEFRSLLSSNCNNLAIAAHDAHIALLYIQDEIAYYIETGTEAVTGILNRALKMVHDFIKHVKLRIKYPFTESNQLPPRQDMSELQVLASSGKLTKKQLIALGCSIYEAAYVNSGISQAAFIVDFGKHFNMKISESYARTAITDIRNDFRDGIPSYFAIFGERLASKMERLNQDSDEAYDKKVKEARLANSGKR